MTRSVKYLIAASIAVWMLLTAGICHFAEIRSWSAHQLWDANIRPAWVRAIVARPPLPDAEATVRQIVSYWEAMDRQSRLDGPLFPPVEYDSPDPVANTVDAGLIE